MAQVSTKEWFLAATPSSVVSLVNVGRLPQNYSEKVAKLFATFKEALVDCPEIRKKVPSKGQTFVLKLLVPSVENSELIQYVKNPTTNQEHLAATQIKTEWIACVYLYTKSAQKLFNNLLNSDFKKPMLVDSKLFDVLAEDVQMVEEAEVKEARLLQPVEGARPHLIRETQGDLLGSRMQTLINTVNCQGVMGKGIALAFKEAYRDMFNDYSRKCKKGEVKVGFPYLYQVSMNRKIINFPTKDSWKKNSKIEWIEQGLIFLAKHVKQWGITSLAIPPLGCGNGGLNWSQVKPLVYKYLEPLGIEIEIYVPFNPGQKRKKPTVPPSKHDKYQKEDVK